MADKLVVGKMSAAIGTVTGRLFDLFWNGVKPAASAITYGADEEQIHPVEETRRKKATDSALINAGKTPGSYMGALRQGQYIGQLAEPGLGIELTESDIGVIIHGAGYAVPENPEDLGKNFVPWVKKNRDLLRKENPKDWDGLLFEDEMPGYGTPSNSPFADLRYQAPAVSL